MPLGGFCCLETSGAYQVTPRLMLSNCGAGEDSWGSFGQQGDPTSSSSRKSTLNIHWKDWGWSWSSSSLVIWFEKMAHWKSPWYCKRLRAEGEKGVRGWDGWMASPTQWTWTCANSKRWWVTGRPGMLQSTSRKESDMTEQQQHMYIYVQQKLAQHCKTTTLQ